MTPERLTMIGQLLEVLQDPHSPRPGAPAPAAARTAKEGPGGAWAGGDVEGVA